LCSTIIPESVFNRLGIVESVLNRLYDRGVGPQLLLDRGDTFLSDSYCVGSGLFSLVATRSVSTVLDLYVEPVIY
jgi:hypothetical protein